MAYRLINARPSPFGRKIAIALIEKGIEFDTQFDEPWGETTCTPDFSPFEQLPILIAPDGAAIWDSAFILEWIETMHPSPALLSLDPRIRLEQRQTLILAERLMEFIQAVVFEDGRKSPSEAWLERQLRKVARGFAALESRISIPAGVAAPIDQGQIGAITTLLAIEYGVARGATQDRPLYRWRQKHDRLCRFADAMEERPSLEATKPQFMAFDLAATVG